MSDDCTFDGFEPANTTPVPDVLFDELLAILSGAEIKVLLYIIRRTRGFKKDTDAISLTQFEKGIITQDGRVLDKGCGLNRETICKALQSLEDKGCIKSVKRNAHKRDKDVTLYSIRFKGEVVGKTDYPSRKIEPAKVVGKSNQGSRKTSKMVVGKSDLQETVLQQTEDNEEVASATPPSLPEKISTFPVENTEQPVMHSTTQPTTSKEKPHKETGASKDKQATIRVANTATPPQQKSETVISEQEQEIWQRWCTVLKKPLPLTKTSTNAVKQLAPLNPSVEDLNAVRIFCYRSNPDWFGAKGRTKGRVTLQDVLNNWEGWVSSQAEPVNLEDMRNNVHKQTALEHGSRPKQAPMTADEIRKTSVWEGVK